MQTEYGTVHSVRKHFGFIKPCSRRLDLYFHFSSLDASLSPEDVQPGLEVQFVVVTEGGKACAKQVAQAPAGAVHYEAVTQQQVLGHVLTAPTFTHGPGQPAGSAGVIRFFAQGDKPAHVTFRSQDLSDSSRAAAGDAQLKAGAFVMFDVSTDNRASAASGQAGARAGQRAVNVQLLTREALQYLQPEQRRQQLALELLQAVVQP
uniref:CSD domain-containing protein n=1 Tax=Chlamydomonas leiostraca TaxID=1034604 RepID=A0A7S0WRR2_9CHLO|mmetsp:Transcript_2533/g.6512  ORF Transcript_2533/g.6512 Transcript_2533/m.6512 type:complete len:205 (+) Transcript_2533:209-823(+)|eukprot:CAMPEP_0202868550 /NCGR_PEP_ID=MMETSP1391-20130828/10940_1 /ASSEMBLY_ACC=CAM_ASM_000867 /TAXON_ID=1034604 /ORGANISM="Chlamydomonas leiostraca, Strain SAG 11-49" /LENGTH=204 /DNA_ID=CAMNT_0049548735 /DNA_START=130 /DNA_END=744 /DNA_ORIENTATION=+